MEKKPKKNRKSETCPAHAALPHPDYSNYLPRLSRARGQIEGIERMIADGRYCVDILVQFRAAMAALRNVEVAVFESHLQHCVSAAMLANDKKAVDAKIRELSELLSRRSVI